MVTGEAKNPKIILEGSTNLFLTAFPDGVEKNASGLGSPLHYERPRLNPGSSPKLQWWRVSGQGEPLHTDLPRLK